MFFSDSNQKRRNRYRSNRAVRSQKGLPTHFVTKWTRFKIILVCIGAMLLATTTIVPIILLEQSTSDPDHFKAPVSLHNLFTKSIELETEYKQKGLSLFEKAKGVLYINNNASDSRVDPNHRDVLARKKYESSESSGDLEPPKTNTGKDSKISEKLPTTKIDKPAQGTEDNGLARGVSGLPMSQTPALVGARRAHVECDLNVDDIAYWNDPQGTRDEEFVSPYLTPKDHYLTFEPDPGGWNNIRMSMEIMFVLAAVTGRTLVLPPNAPFYLLGQGEKGARSFGNFFPLEHPQFKKRVKVITMKDFVEKEGKSLLELPDDEMKTLAPISEMCLHQPKSEIRCEILFTHLRKVGFQPDMGASPDEQCLVFDEDAFHGRKVAAEAQERVSRFCGWRRKPYYYDQDLHGPQLIHWDASNADKHRLLNHFYTFMFFTDPVTDNYYKRFVRDFLHYKDLIYCAAGKIVHALNNEGKSWSSLHVRRGDFQYKQVKLPAEELYNNTKEIWQSGEILFIATDERNKTFFDPLKQNHELRFLDDYWDMAKLGDLDSTFLGMVDTIVASHGRVFAGTWFSTFTGYINRMRGYVGHSMHNSWYSWLERKQQMLNWTYPNGNYPAREWPLGWVGIDGDEIIEHEGEPVVVIDVGGAKVSSRDQRKIMPIGLSDLKTDEWFQKKGVSRGVAGRPSAETPALVGASRAHIECDVNVDSLAYWNDPQGKRDEDFVSPFKAKGEEKYITFTVDRGGWNNVRMSMEIIFIVAAATGRTLVLPPKEPLYRLRADAKNLHRGFADFFPLHTEEFQKRVKIISMEDFVRREGSPDGRVPIPEALREGVINSAEHCDKRKESKASCTHIAEYLAGAGFVPDARAKDYCFIFDKDVYEGNQLSDESKLSVSNFCGTRNQTYWTSDLQEHPLIHFRAGDKQWRLLTHFYGFFHFTDPAIDNYYKRFVRDFLHYHDAIYCAAGKIVKALQAEAMQRGFTVDENGVGGFSAMHIRRGDFQYVKVKLPAEEWYDNTKEIWQPKEILYIATDERNKTFFDPIGEHHDVRFLDDYVKLAGLDDLDPNYFGMIDTIVSSRARAFAGTWFSTFTGYINRMRGYHGMTMKDSWYSFLERKTKTHEWVDIDHFAYAYEWPTGWVGIDADTVPEKDEF